MLLQATRTPPSCPICRASLTDPRLLPCGHLCCLPCLFNLARLNEILHSVDSDSSDECDIEQRKAASAAQSRHEQAQTPLLFSPFTRTPRIIASRSLDSTSHDSERTIVTGAADFAETNTQRKEPKDSTHKLDPKAGITSSRHQIKRKVLLSSFPCPVCHHSHYLTSKDIENLPKVSFGAHSQLFAKAKERHLMNPPKIHVPSSLANGIEASDNESSTSFIAGPTKMEATDSVPQNMHKSLWKSPNPNQTPSSVIISPATDVSHSASTTNTSANNTLRKNASLLQKDSLDLIPEKSSADTKWSKLSKPSSRVNSSDNTLSGKTRAMPGVVRIDSPIDSSFETNPPSHERIHHYPPTAEDNRKPTSLLLGSSPVTLLSQINPNCVGNQSIMTKLSSHCSNASGFYVKPSSIPPTTEQLYFTPCAAPEVQVQTPIPALPFALQKDHPIQLSLELDSLQKQPASQYFKRSLEESEKGSDVTSKHASSLEHLPQDQGSVVKRGKTKNPTCFCASCRNESEKYCIYGCGYICLCCLDKHDAFFNHGHLVIDVSEKIEHEKRDQPLHHQPCPRHPQYAVDYLCANCPDPRVFCPLCFSEFHSGHAYLALDDDIRLSVEMVDKLKADSEALAEEIKRRQSDISRNLMDVKENAKIVCDRIKARTQEIIEAVKIFEGDLISEVTKTQNQAVADLQDKFEQLESHRRQTLHSLVVATKATGMSDSASKAFKLRQARNGLNLSLEQKAKVIQMDKLQISLKLEPSFSIRLPFQPKEHSNQLGSISLDTDGSRQIELPTPPHVTNSVNERETRTQDTTLENSNPKSLHDRQSCTEENKELNSPHAVAIHPRDGRVFVADTCNHRIVILSPTMQWLFSFGRYGTDMGQFNTPVDICISADGTVVVSDLWNYRLQLFDSDGGYLRTIGCEGSDPGQLGLVFGMCLDSQGFLYAADYGNNRIQIFSLQGDLVHVIQNPTPSPECIESFILRKPTGVAVLSDGSVWCVCDEGKWLRHIGLQGECFSTSKVPNTSDWVHICCGPGETLLLTDENSPCLFLYGNDGQIIQEIPCSDEIGLIIKSPAGCALVSADKILVCDASASKLELISLHGL